jgi:hypothetical protein
MLCVPAASVEVVYFAAPLLSATVPSVVVPSLKVTFPVGVTLNCGLTVAVNVTDCPLFDGFADEVNVVAVLAWLTTCFTVADVLPVNDVLPP